VTHSAPAGGYAGDWCYTLPNHFYLTLYVRMVITTIGVNAITISFQIFVCLLEPQK